MGKLIRSLLILLLFAAAYRYRYRLFNMLLGRQFLRSAFIRLSMNFPYFRNKMMHRTFS